MKPRRRGPPISFALVLLAAAFGTARAADYHVMPTGNDAWPGTSPDSAWATIARANVAARPGDRVYIWPNPGVYAHFPHPDSAGSNPTGGGFITFIGASPLGDPITDTLVRKDIKLPSGEMSTPYTVLKGVWIDGICLFRGTARYDTLAYSTLLGDLVLDGCDYSVVSHCEGLGARLSIAYVGTDGSVVGCTVEDCNFLRLGQGVQGGNHRFITGNTERAKCDSLLFARNRLITVIEDILDSHPRVHFYTQHSTFRNNYHRIYTTLPGREFYAMRLRDSTMWNRFVGDTIIMSGPALGILYWSSSGDSLPQWQKSVGNIEVDSCYVNMLGCAGSRMLFQQGMFNWTFRYNTLICHGRVLDASDVKGKTLIDHNTIVGGPYLGIVNFDKTDYEPGFSDTMTFTNNLLYSTFHGDPNDFLTNNCAIFAHSQAFDSAGVGRLQSDHNLFTYYGYRFDPGDRAHRWDQGQYSPTGPNEPWSNTFGNDAHSIYASPLFVDSALTPTFDPRVRSDSPVRGAGTDGSDIGAVAFVPNVGVAAAAGAADLALRADPNPARGAVVASFTLPRAGEVRLEVFDVSGRRVATLARGPLPAGRHERRWNAGGERGEALPAGIYLIRLRAGADHATRRVALIR